MSIKPKTRVSKIEMIKEIIRAQGINPEQILTRDALNQPATTYQDPTHAQEHQWLVLTKTLRELIHQETQRIAVTG
ncbi:hypothetical protein E6H36_12910 [Candidatus Bathyarchaeota archaeon]|nr:MAG: hypothetical protein E6H36_12910 [Candidatus Bathyarchaeota archaeon]